MKKAKVTAAASVVSLKEQVRALKRKLLVTERMRFEAALKSPEIGKNRTPWDAKILAAGVAHEFNNILGAADGHAEWALQTGNPHDMKEALEVVRLACQRSLHITKSLQELPSPREEAAVIFPVSRIHRDLARHFRPLSLKTGIELRINEGEVELYGNENAFFEVCLNLVKNAFEALSHARTPEGRVEISLLSVPGKARVKWVVTDNGPGIPVALLERLFHPFVTTKGRMRAFVDRDEESDASSSENESQSGSGLGLFLSRSIVHKMGGRLAYSKRSKGARFQIVLPVVSRGAAKRPPRPRP